MKPVFSTLLGAVGAAMLALASPAMAQDPDLGPSIGTAIPHDLAVDGQPGFDAIKGEQGLVLFFVRSVDWCPYCKNQVIDISGNYDEFTSRGYEVAYLSYDNPAKQAQFQAKRGIQGVLISDLQSEVIDAFGLRNTNHKEGSFAFGVPHPAVFIIDPDGVIKGKLYESDYASDRKSYQDRPAVTVILQTIDAL